jgi:hypothetical protein
MMTTTTAGAAAADWKLAQGPLMTRWAKQVDPNNVLPEYPRPQMVRKDWLNLNGLWEFASAQDVKDAPIGKPLEGRILVPFCVESALSGVMKVENHVWYRRTFTVPDPWNGKRVLLHFGAVDHESTVLVNGQKVGSHVGGYDEFSFDITEALKNNGTGEQELIVEVTDNTADTQARGKQNTNPHGIWYTPCTGIWQTVWLEPAVDIAGLKITPDLDAGSVTIEISYLDGARNRDATVEIRDGDRLIVQGSAGQAFHIHNARQWCPDQPFLYSIRATTENDTVDSYFAMRKISIGSDGKFQRILLNDKPIFQVGPLDQGFWPDGIYTAPTDEALRFDIEQTKRLGFNMIRKHVKVEPQRFYYWCDKLGLLVWQDMPSAFRDESAESRKQFEAEWERIVDQHRNSPCIVMWVPFNEGWGQYDTQRIAEWTKKLDSTRLVNNASGWTDFKAGDVHDIHKYPGPGAPPTEKYRAAVLGEFGGLGLTLPKHTWAGEKGFSYQGTEDSKQLTERYVRLLGRVHELKDTAGLCAAVYTQTTDVELELNGLLTYDREVLKVDVDRVRAANLGQTPRVTTVEVMPTSQKEPQTWRYTFGAPAEGWMSRSFDASKWKEGPGGFGTEGTPGAVVHTTWNTPDIWLRREFELPKDVKPEDLLLIIHHDEEAEVYINGVLAWRRRNFQTDYEEFGLRAEAYAAIKPQEKNVLAIHCRQTTGGQYIDAGLVRLAEKR